jgi:hypothetical protein
MGKSVSVKVRTGVLVQALERALANRKQKFEDSQRQQADYQEQVAKHEAKLVKLVKSGKGIIQGTPHREWRDRPNGMVAVGVTLLFPKSAIGESPECGECYAEWEYNKEREEISNAIRVLGMTEQEFVNASTLSSVSKFL